MDRKKSETKLQKKGNYFLLFLYCPTQFPTTLRKLLALRPWGSSWHCACEETPGRPCWRTKKCAKNFSIKYRFFKVFCIFFSQGTNFCFVECFGTISSYWELCFKTYTSWLFSCSKSFFFCPPNVSLSLLLFLTTGWSIRTVTCNMSLTYWKTPKQDL